MSSSSQTAALVIDGARSISPTSKRWPRRRPRWPCADAAREAVRASRRVVDDAVARGDVVYGVTTGFGNFADVLIPADRLRELQLNLVRSHAAGVGDAARARPRRAR